MRKASLRMGYTWRVIEPTALANTGLLDDDEAMRNVDCEDMYRLSGWFSCRGDSRLERIRSDDGE